MEVPKPPSHATFFNKWSRDNSKTLYMHYHTTNGCETWLDGELEENLVPSLLTKIRAQYKTDKGFLINSSTEFFQSN